MPVLGYFSNAYYINLDRRQDRLEQVKGELARIGLEAERVAGYDLADPDHPDSGRLGCTLSHLQVVLQAKRLRLPNVLILEDDLVFASEFLEVAKGATEELANMDWDLFYFGYSNFGYGHESLTPVGKYIGCCESVYLTHCYAINACAYDKTIDMILRSRSLGAIDWLFVHNSQLFKVLCSIPRVAFQRLGFSDVEGKVIQR